jgi:pimeloyl-ACP methyl ester carboxylesterase
MKNLTRRKEGGYEFKMNLPILKKHYHEILAAVEGEHPFDGPSLFIRGGRSRHIVEGDEILIKKLFPGAVVETIEKAGHWVHADAPVQLLKLLEAFLK